VRRGVRDQLNKHEGWTVCGEAGDGREAVHLALQLEPNVVVMDLTMPELNGLEATRQIRRVLSRTEILIFSMHDSEHLMREALLAGARGYVLKSDHETHLTSAVEALAHHKPYFTGRASDALLDSFLRSEIEDEKHGTALTDREREVVQLLAEGRSNKEVATRLSISVKTVETHRAAVMRKLDITSIVGLVHYAIRNQLVEA
jgi:DNA-binding NarL/FixJ family response regulator